MSRVAALTGTSSGIGVASARRLVKESFEVVVGPRRIDRRHSWTDATGASADPLDVIADESAPALADAVLRGGAVGLEPFERASIDETVLPPRHQATTGHVHRRPPPQEVP